ncbi:OB-fold domain-containing protein [Bacillus sp. FJAT-29790]|uniref:Zn-ribbon domain-containing OB-fold protein n=1 Tax=Bacillus sp. FJAT-29790 TaxID=1895002 RepID=UPI001C24BE76|nr:OB-fold domain-containing protein [Bacillus sp. FJAT-29790]MBU8878729.1 OB-fold domain-containing protein [Bacillus sp. FJAT-29790]
MTEIQVYECAQCEKKFVQRKWICPNCQHTEFQLKKIKGEGKVFSHTTIHVSSNEFSHLTPYTIALIELQEGLRLTGRVTERVDIDEEVACISKQENTYVFAKKTLASS